MDQPKRLSSMLRPTIPNRYQSKQCQETSDVEMSSITRRHTSVRRPGKNRTWDLAIPNPKVLRVPTSARLVLGDNGVRVALTSMDTR
jgi:hypothetical protein